VRAPSAGRSRAAAPGTTLIELHLAGAEPELMQQLAAKKATVLAIDCLPRQLSRAQKMDALTSMAGISGYRAVIEAANAFGRFFNGQVTAAGKIPPAKVFIAGAGVAGLAAIGTAANLGAIVRANDTRAEVADQVVSLGGEFVKVDYEEEGSGGGGYAKVMSEGFQQAQREMYAKQAREVDIIITTALIPGKPAPKLITAEMVQTMKPGSVIVDMAAEQGGNCELTVPGEAVVRHGVTIIGYTDLASRLAKQSSTLYSNNLLRLTEELCKTKDGTINVNFEDDAIRGLTVIKDGEVTWPAPPPKLPAHRRSPAAAAARPEERPRPRRRERAHVGRQSLAIVFGVGALLFWLVGRSRRPAFLGALHGVRARLLRRLHGRVERHALAAHAADERDQRDLEHHRGRRAGAGGAAAGRRHRPARRADPRPRGLRARADRRQHVRRLRRHASHARDVPQVRGSHGMSANLATVAYIGAAILFILSLGGLSNPETARRGNLYGMVGMTIAVLATVFGPRVTAAGIPYIVGALLVGGAIGLYAAKKVQMTQMPELVALMHSLVGLAACLVGFASYIDTSVVYEGAEKAIHEVEIYIGILIGAVTFSGSIIAFGKLSGKIGGKPLLLPARHWLNLAGLLVVIWFGGAFVQAHDVADAGMTPLLVMTVIALLFGIHMVMAIGGADMPVVVSMLNSYSGWAAAATGFMLSNDLLIVTGALVGSSGAILSYIMCRAMNRSSSA
jgi:NAD(P) transhydrogenase alpha subunit